MTWIALTHSSIGVSHKKQQQSCQDYGAYQIFDDIIVGAVADGAGSAKHSDLGAKIAVNKAIAYLGKIREYLQKRKRWWENISKPTEPEVNRLFKKTITQVQAKLNKEAKLLGYHINDLACTLLVFIATPHWIAGMQIGDGFIVIRSSDDYQMLFQPDKGEFINETTFITSANALAEIQIKIISEPPDFICASTDGLEKVAIRLSDWQPFGPFFQPLAECLTENTSLEQKQAYIEAFLESDRLNAKTDDDKTLLICLYNSSQPDPMKF